MNGDVKDELFRKSVSSTLMGLAPRSDKASLANVNLSKMGKSDAQLQLQSLMEQLNLKHVESVLIDDFTEIAPPEPLVPSNDAAVDSKPTDTRCEKWHSSDDVRILSFMGSFWYKHASDDQSGDESLFLSCPQLCVHALGRSKGDGRVSWDVYAKWDLEASASPDGAFVQCASFILGETVECCVLKQSISTSVVCFAPERRDNSVLIKVTLRKMHLCMPASYVNAQLVKLERQLALGGRSSEVPRPPNVMSTVGSSERRDQLPGSDSATSCRKLSQLLLAASYHERPSSGNAHPNQLSFKSGVSTQHESFSKQVTEYFVESFRTSQLSTTDASAFQGKGVSVQGFQLEGSVAPEVPVGSGPLPPPPEIPCIRINARPSKMRRCSDAFAGVTLSDEKIYSGETSYASAFSKSIARLGSVYFDEDMANDGEGFLGGIKDAWIGYLQAMGSDEDN